MGKWMPVSGKLVLQEWDNLATGWAVYDDGATLLVSTDAGSGEYKLPDDLRLCRLVPDEGSLPVEVAEAIMALVAHQEASGYSLTATRIRRWLRQHQKGGE